MKRPKLGALGTFSEGKLNPSDQGDLALAITWDERNQVVRLDFGKPVAWFAMSAHDARVIAEMILEKAEQAGR